MTREDAQFYTSLAEFILKQAEMQAVTTKLFLQRLDNLESRFDLHRNLTALADGDEKREIAALLDSIEKEAATQRELLRAPIFSAIARMESDHEKIEAVIATLKSSLDKPPGQE